jgi:intein/homing endonuclease
MAHDGHICLLPNQKIICDEVTKNIEDVKFGDEVLTHKGRFSKVIGTSERHYEGKINIIRTKKFNFNLKVTEDHPVLVAIPNIIIDEKSRHIFTKWNEVDDKKLVGNMIYGRNSNDGLNKSINECKGRFQRIKKYVKKDFVLMWKNASMVDENDFLVFPIVNDKVEKIGNKTQHRCIYCKSEKLNKKGFTPNGSRRWHCVKCKKSFIDKFMHCNVLDDLYDKDLCYLIGLFLADGCANVGGGKLRFFVGDDFKDKVCDKIKKVFKTEPKIYPITNTDKCYDISVHSTKLTRLFNELGKNENKHPMKEILTMPLEYQESFLEGYEDGDGCIRVDSRNGYVKSKFMSISTISPSNLFIISQILLRKGIIPSISERDRMNFKKDKKLDGSVYMIQYSKCKNIHSLRGIIHGDNLLLPVKSNLTEEYSGMVYNLSVENDNTFVTLNGVVHNCLDEFWLYVDSRSSASTKNRVTSNIILKSRKRDLTFMFTSQLLDLLDKRVRKILDFTAYTILNPNESVGKTLIFRGGYPKEAMILKTMRFYTAGVFQLYNTREEIEMIEDDGQPPKIIFQESPEHPPKYFDDWESADKFAENFWAKHPELISLLMAGQ